MKKICARVVLPVFLLTIMLLNAVCVQPGIASELPRQLIEARRHRLRGEIGIFYDPFDPVISQTAWDVYTALDIANVSSSLYEVSSAFELEHALSESGVWIAVYLFNSGLEGVTLGREVVGWKDFAQFLLRYKSVHHILGIGNTRKLAEYVGEDAKNIHLAETDLVDVKLTFLYSLWAVAEVLEKSKDYRHKEAELDIRRVGLKFFADNFNDLFERTLEPKVPLGKEDLAQKQKDFEEMKKRFPKSLQVLPLIPPGGMAPNEWVKTGSSNVGSLLVDASSVPPPRLYLARMPGTATVVNEAVYADAAGVSRASGSAVGEDGSAVELLFKVLDIPMKSGVDGPIGSVLDFLLEVLIKVGGYTSAALGEDTVKRIVNAVSAIKTIIGLTQDSGGESALKGLFDILRLEFPALEEYEKFFDLFVDAMYALRGDLQEIVNWVSDALVVLVDELPMANETKQAIKDSLSEILDLGEEFYDIIRSSENVLEALLGWFLERILPKIADKLLKDALPGLAPDHLIDGVEKIGSILNAIVKFAISPDSSSLLDSLLSVFEAFDLVYDLGWTAISRIRALIKLVWVVLGYSDEVPETLSEFIPSTLFTIEERIVNEAYARWSAGDHYLYYCGRPDDDSDNGWLGDYPHDCGDDEGILIDGRWKYETTAALGRAKVAAGDPWITEERVGYNQYKYYDHCSGNGGGSTGTPSRQGPCKEHMHFDCSGLVWYCYDKAGYQWPREWMPRPVGTTRFGGPTAETLRDMCRPIPKEELQPADLCFKHHHVGIYVGHDPNIDKYVIIEANGHSRGVVRTLYETLSDLDHEWALGTLLRRVEPLYFGSFEHTVNNSPAMELVPKFLVYPPNFRQASFVGPTTRQDEPCEVGVRIWRRRPNGVMNEITAGEPVAVVKVHHGYQRVLKKGMWVSPALDMGRDDNFVVEVYARTSQLFEPEWNSLGIWSTKHLMLERLEKITWTVSYNLTYSVQPTEDPPGWVGTVAFAFGDSATNSRITPYIPPAQIPEASPEEWFSGDVGETTSTSTAASMPTQENIETTGNIISELVSQIMYDIDEAIKQERTDVIAFGDGIRTHLDDALEQANLTVEESTKQVLVDAIVLVAGVMNPKFLKSSLPTLPAVVRNVLQAVTAPTDAIDIIDNVVSSIVAVIAMITEDAGITQIISGAPGEFESQYTSMGILIGNTVELTLRIIGVEATTIEEVRSYIDTFTTVSQATFNIIKAWRENTIQGIIQTIIQGVGFTLSQYYEIDLQAYAKILEIAFPQAMGVTEPPTPQEAVTIINRTLRDIGLDPADPVDSVIIDVVTTVVEYIAEIRDIFTDGYQWIKNKIMEWLSGKVEELADYLNSELSKILSQCSFFHVDGKFPVGLGKFSLFELRYDLALDAGLNLRTDELFTFVENIIFEGYDLNTSSLEDVLKTILSFAEIVPLFKGSLELSGFGSEENDLMSVLLEGFGVDLQFEGGGHFTLQLLSFKGGAFERSGFMKVLEWGFWFSIEVSRDFTLADLFTGGVGGSALVTVAEYVGLPTIVIRISFGLTLEIIKRAASPTGPEQGTFSLIIEIGAAIIVGLSIAIAGIEIIGSLKVIFTFTQDLVGDTPLKILMDIVAHIKVTIEFLFTDWDSDWGPKTLYHHDFTARTTSAAEEANETMGVDKDHDGLSDEYEKAVRGLRLDCSDTDGDGLTDKEEIQTTNTDPINPDTDGDGLDDYEEIYIHKSHPKRVDTDYDGLDDYEEVTKYGTIPTVMDTDEDGLDDYYEVHHIWDNSNCTPSVKEVWIGGVAYDDHTDPLNPDTDNDGLLDGEEGPAGIYYGAEELRNWSHAGGPVIDRSDNATIFNYGYTHPLDNDTDDDSYLQLWNGTVARVMGEKRFLCSMMDGEEVEGTWIELYNATEDEWERKLVRTNPCNADTDADTGNPAPGPNVYLNSDGYELSTNPPTDPTNGDTDHDGLLDGLEGVVNPKSYHTNPSNPDTDGDGLGDLQEVGLATSARNPDTDHDAVLDGDEYHRFHTNPLLPDSDYDGLTDGEEVWFWHTNPHIRDSDYDRISDGLEVLKYDTDPLDEDTDNDEINDYDEIFKHGTDPLNPDTDGDDLRDGEEAYDYLSDPLNWDTDGDSIPYPNEHGQMTWPMSDGDEVHKFRTNPIRTDTDDDGLSDALELYLNSSLIPRSVLKPIPLKPLNNDTDRDGLLDGQELRIGNMSSIIYPYLALMPYSFYNTSVVHNDTDRDGLSDFEEVNGTLPSDRSFEAGVAKFNYTGSLADMWDTDNDTLSDGYEVFYHGTDPTRADTDGDGLLDCHETTMNDTSNGGKSKVYYASLAEGEAVVIGTPNASFSFSPSRQTAEQPVTFDASTSYDLDGTISTYFWDFGDGTNATAPNPIITHTYLIYGTYVAFLTVTDNDGLNSTVKGTVNIRLETSAISPDTDEDLLPDGYEMDPDTIENVTRKYGILLDPLNNDTNTNSIIDGLEIDSDDDGLFDGQEFYVYETQKAWRKGSFVAGGFLNPDSDGDGLSDGLEVYEFKTVPSEYDTDKDGYSDGAEVAAGTDPLMFTSKEEYQQALDTLRAGRNIRIISPLNATTLDRNISVRALNSTPIETMWFQYNDGTGWPQNFTMEYDPAEEQWKNTTVVWDYKSYHIQVFGRIVGGSYVYWDEVWFTVGEPPPPTVGWMIKIVSPLNATTYDKDVDIHVVTSTAVNKMRFRYDSGAGWSNNFTMAYNQANQQWENTTITWSVGSHHLQVFATTPTGLVHWDEIWFTVAEPKEKPQPVHLWLLAGVAMGVAIAFVSAFFLFRRRAKTSSVSRVEGKLSGKKEDKK